MEAEKKITTLSSLRSTFADWEVGPNYEIVKHIGSGSYG